MEIIADPLFYAAAIPAVLIAGISKAGVGGGLGIVAVPLMTLVIAPVQAAGIMLPLLCAMDIAGLWAYRGLWHRRNMAMMLPGALTGIAIGGLSFHYLNDEIVKLLIGTVALAFVAYRAAGETVLRLGARPATLPGPRGAFWAGVAGFTSTVAHAGAPPVQVYLLPQRLDKSVYVGTMVVFFAVVNYTKLIPYGLLGQLSPGNLGTALALAPAVPAGIWLGLRFHRMLSDKWFYRLVFAVLTATGLRLAWDGAAGLGAG